MKKKQGWSGLLFPAQGPTVEMVAEPDYEEDFITEAIINDQEICDAMEEEIMKYRNTQ